MGTLDLTVQVLNISPKATVQDLIIFFSYCGTIDEIQMQRPDNRQGDQSQVAYVSFKQPYAVQTALLLNDAIIVDRHVRISPLENVVTIPIESCSPNNRDTEAQNERGGILLAAQEAVLQAVALKGQEVLNKAKEQVLDTGSMLSQQANLAIAAAEQTVNNIGSAIRSRNCFSSGALWLSGVLDKASKSMAELGDPKRRGTNSRKLK